MNPLPTFLSACHRTCSRRAFLGAGAGILAAAAGFGFLNRSRSRKFRGRILGASATVGHLLRDGKLPAPGEQVRTRVAIVGGGIAGLAAARQLARAGHDDFLLLELEDQPGGNSCSGQNAISSYPWGAHYVPLPGSEAKEIVTLFEELGIITGRDADGQPVYNELYLCADPDERLFIHGEWQEGLVPGVGLSATDRTQMGQFFATMEKFKSATGNDGRPAFCIPIDRSSRDPEFLKLDQISMAQYLADHGWNSDHLRWYVNYCCRDDYGAEMKDTSAWAGIHYFASRTGKAANADTDTVVTWPEGNGWIVNRLREPIAPRIRSSALVFHVEQAGNGAHVDYFDVARQRSVRIEADSVIFAAPRFVAHRVIRERRESAPIADGFEYSPWMVANISLDYLPQGPGAPLSWDNVLYRSESLGYVVATHQHLHPFPKRTVLTYYLPLSAKPPVEARQEMLATTYDQWAERIVEDLSRAHPDIADHILQLDVWLWGHGMIRPSPGFIWGPQRAKALEPLDRIVFAHSDMSGISIFEEAYIRGVEAARVVLAKGNA